MNIEELANATDGELADAAYTIKRQERKLALKRLEIEAVLKQKAMENGGRIIIIGDVAKATITQAEKVVCELNKGHLPSLRRRLGEAYEAHIKEKFWFTKDSLEKLPGILGKYAKIKEGPVAIRYHAIG